MIKGCIALGGLLLFSCTSGKLTPEGLTQYIQDEDNGLRKTAVVNGITLAVTYKPTDLWVKQEVEGSTVSEAAIDSLRKKYNAYYYFILSLSKENKEALNPSQGMGEYSDLVQTMSFRMPEYVTLTTAQDSIPVGDFMLNRTYGLSASTDILFVFSKEKTASQEWIQFNLNEFGLGVGNQRFRFRAKDLENVPTINF